MRIGSNISPLRVTSALLVTLLSLASARSLVPGLCATQAALDDRAEACVTSCCETPSRAADGEGPAARSDAKVACAFCKLATTLVTAPVVVHIERAATTAEHQVQALETYALVDSIDQAHAGRAPPALSLV